MELGLGWAGLGLVLAGKIVGGILSIPFCPRRKKVEPSSPPIVYLPCLLG